MTSAPAGTTRPLCGGGRGWSPSAAPRAPSFCVRCKKEAVFVCHADCSHYARVHPKGAAKQLKIGARHHRNHSSHRHRVAQRQPWHCWGGQRGLPPRAAIAHCCNTQLPSRAAPSSQVRSGPFLCITRHHLPSSRHRKAAAVNLLGSQLLTRMGFSLLLVLHADGTRCAEQRAALQEPKPAQRVGRI